MKDHYNSLTMTFKKIIILVLDGCGIGQQDDYLEFQDIETNTIGNIYKIIPNFSLPWLESMGLNHLLKLTETNNERIPGWFGKMKQQALGNDTFAGIWEMVGVVFNCRFVSNIQELSDKITKKINSECDVLTICNKYISGYIALDKYYDEHIKTKLPILYLSDDGVILLAAHEEIMSANELNNIAQKISKTIYNLGYVRIITRPFYGERGHFVRNESERKDFLLLETPTSNLITDLVQSGVSVRMTKHLNRIFNFPPGTMILKENYNNNSELFSLINRDTFENYNLQLYVIPDTDNFGHQKNLVGFSNCLIEIDHWLQEYTKLLSGDDLLIITADHGCDPTSYLRGHCREYVPLLVYNKNSINSFDLGIRNTFSDIGQTIAMNFNLRSLSRGISLL